jgi:hypothetical protein
MLAAFNYVSSQEFVHIFFVFSLLYFILVSISLLTVLVILFFVKGNSPFLKETKTFFFSLSLFKKIVFCYFCVFASFPNKVYVNNGFTFIGNYFLNLFHGGIKFFLFALLGFIFILESIVFGLSYEYSSKFKTFIVKTIFCENKDYADAYILYF